MTVASKFEQNMIEHALALAGSQWPVFPLQPRSKVPYPHTRGHNDATTDVARIAEWWRLAPDSNIGLRPPEGIVVVDVDSRHGGDATLRALPPLPATLTTRTGSGGLHAFFTAPTGLSWPAHLVTGIDLKTSRGYLWRESSSCSAATRTSRAEHRQRAYAGRLPWRGLI